MRPATALTLGVTALVTACTDSVAPSVPHAAMSASLVSGSAVEFAYHACYDVGGYTVECQLIVAYANGSRTALVSFGDFYAQHLATWSPDAARIAFADDLGEVIVMSIADLGRVNLTNHPALDRSPAWSADGARIVFQSDRDGAQELYIMNANGSNVVRRE